MSRMAFLFLAFFVSSLNAQPTFCLKLSEVSNDGITLVVKIEMQGNEAFSLGSSNLQFSFDNTILGAPSLASSPLAPPFYQVPTVTTPLPNQASFNIELGFPGFGSQMAAAPNWTELGQLSFPIQVQGAGGVGNMIWSYNGGTTQTVVFLDDEATQIFATSVEPSCLIPILGALPVSLTTFEAVPEDDYIDVRWTTNLEINLQRYGVERRVEGSEFEEVADVEPLGTGNSVYRNYSFHDEDVLKGVVYYYRLKMIDESGDFDYSEVRSASLKAVLDELVYPNPASSYFKVSIVNPLYESATLRLIDLMGRVFLEQKATLYEGKTIIHVNCEHLPRGVYFLEVETKNDLLRVKVVLSSG